MGIPKFYRWLSERYPLINQKINTQVTPEFDNLYLDMNAIFHRCSHGEEVNKYTITKSKMFTDIFKYISYLVQLTKPRTLLYLAVDGVAPRAKQNQQRQRRFVGATEMKAEEEMASKTKLYNFDSNIITPGTRWMEELTRQLELFIRKQISEDNLWKHLTVIYSDHLVPGEGEHKIMSHIRSAKMQPEYDPNTRHCIYGLDADLVILSLVAHEMHFALLREEIIFALHEQESVNKRTRRRLTKKGEFQLLHITVLRHYLYIEFCNTARQLPFKFDFERIVDDFVFISMFVGNDFIPHSPTVNIGTGGMEHLFNIYKQVLPTLGGYILVDGLIDIQRFKVLCARLAETEIDCFVQQFQFLKMYHEKASRRKHSYFPMLTIEKTQNFRQFNVEQLSAMIVSLRDSTNPETCKKFRTKYYSSRWKRELTIEDRRRICLDYVRALQWIVNYYYQGVCSWGYYFPHHYAPLISDMQYIDETNQQDVDHIRNFDLGVPFKPFEQLLAVLPRHSNWMLPEAYRVLMEDPKSPISKYYPEKFEVDMNLSVSPWEGIALLPFIDEADLKVAIKSIDANLTEDQKFVNDAKEAIVFNYDYKKSLMKSRIKGPVGFGPIGDDVVCRKYHEPSLDHCGGKFSPTVCKGAKAVLPGSPHMGAIPFSFFVKKVPVKTFGMSSKYQTMVVQVIDQDSPIDPTMLQLNGSKAIPQETKPQQTYENLALGYLKKFLSHPLYCGWPYFREAQITEINTLNFTHSIVHLLDNKTHTMTNQLTPQQRTKFKKLCHSVSQRYLSIYGVDVGDIHILLKCRMLWGMVKNENDIVKKWCNEEQVFPIQVCICGSSKSGYDDIGHISTAGDAAMSTISSPRPSQPVVEEEQKSVLDEASALNEQMLSMMGFMNVGQPKNLVLDDRFFTRKLTIGGGQGVGSPVMYIGPQQKYHGLCGRITKAPENGFVDIRVLSRFHPTDFPHRVLSRQTPDKYFSLEEAAHILQLDYKVLSRICAQVIVVHKPMDFDIGLNLKLYKKRLLIPGYCWVQFLKPKQNSRRNNGGRNNKRRGNQQKERLLVKISQKAMDLIAKYKEKFPEVFSVLRCKHYSKQFYPDEFSRDAMKRLLPSQELSKLQQQQQANPRAPAVGPFANPDANTSVTSVNGNSVRSSSVITSSNTSVNASVTMVSTTSQSQTSERSGNSNGLALAESTNASSSASASSSNSISIALEEKSQSVSTTATTTITGSDDLMSDTVQHCGVEEVEEEEIQITMDDNVANGAEEEEEEEVVDFSATGEMKMVEEEETVDMSAVPNVAELSAEDYKMLIRTKKCAEGKNFLMKINEWLQDQEVSKLPLVDFKSKFLPMEVMREIEDEATKYYNTQIRNTPKAYHLKRVPVAQVYFANPEVPWSPTKQETFHLGNRVSSLRSDEGIPFGCRGTVVALHDTFLEMITDINVMKGNTLHNRCSDHRGVIVPYSSVLNLTPNKAPPGHLMVAESASESTRSAMNDRSHSNNNGAQNMAFNDGANGQQNRKQQRRQNRGQDRNQNSQRNRHNPNRVDNRQQNMRNGNNFNPQQQRGGRQNNHGPQGGRQNNRAPPHQNNLLLNQRMLNANNLDMHFNQQMLNQNGSTGVVSQTPLSSVPSLPSNHLLPPNMLLNQPLLNGNPGQLPPNSQHNPNLQGQFRGMNNQNGPNGIPNMNGGMVPLSVPNLSIPNFQSGANQMGMPMQMGMNQMPMGMQGMSIPNASQTNPCMTPQMMGTPSGSMMGHLNQFNNLNIINHNQNHLTMQMQQNMMQQQQQMYHNRQMNGRYNAQFNGNQQQGMMPPQQNQFGGNKPNQQQHGNRGGGGPNKGNYNQRNNQY